MRAWTYRTAPERGPYWRSDTTNLICLEYPDGRLEWREVETGAVARTAGLTQPGDYHKGKLLDASYLPEWYHHLNDDLDIGL